MAMAPSPARRWWTTKRRILVALAGIIVVAAFVSVISVVLRPGKILFSITHAYNANSTDKGGTVQLNLTVSANNTSHRLVVHYRSLDVSLQYTSPAPERTTYTIPAEATSEAWRQPQPPGSSMKSVNVSALMSMDDWISDFPRPRGSGRQRRCDRTAAAGGSRTLIEVLVVTMVQFKVGPAYTRPYHVRALCDPVDYFFNGSLANTSISCRDA